jgi:hypothetical protein
MIKLYYYDDKHQQILNYMHINTEDRDVIKTLIGFLETQGLTDNRYNCLKLAKSYEYIYEDGERSIKWEY